MKAVVKFAPGPDGVELRDVPKPVPKSNELLVKVMAAGVCGTDIHILHDEYRHITPVTLGHEFTGIVEEMGSDVEGFAIGDQVIAMPAADSCGQCIHCASGDYFLCESKKSIGSDKNGAMAEYVVVPYDRSFKVPENMVGNDAMAISEPLACCIRIALETSKVKGGDVAVVIGPGTMGLLTMQMAKVAGAFLIVAGLPHDKKRLEIAKELGADVICDNPSELKSIVHKYAPGGADVVYECSGAAPCINLALDVIKKTGNLAQVGLYGKPVSVPMDAITTREIVVTGNGSQAKSSWIKLLQLARLGLLNIEPLVTHRIPLVEYKKAFEIFEKKEGIKVVLVP